MPSGPPAGAVINGPPLPYQPAAGGIRFHEMNFSPGLAVAPVLFKPRCLIISPVEIRPLASCPKDEWLPLWRAYVVFYEVCLRYAVMLT